MSDPDDLSFDPRSWFGAPDEAAPSAPPRERAAREGRSASRVLAAGLAAAAILLAGAAAAFVTRVPPAQVANASSGVSR